MSEPIGGYLATPEKGAGPAVIVIPDGPEFCDRLAAMRTLEFLRKHLG